MTAADAKFNWSNTEIQLCKKCGGKGHVPEQISMEESTDIVCPWCNGSGRVVKTATVKYDPYEAEE